MVMPCCNHCYKKYIKADGEISQQFVESAFGKGSVVEVRQEKNPFTRNNLPLLERTYVINGKKEESLCTCACHVEGINCMH